MKECGNLIDIEKMLQFPYNKKDMPDNTIEEIKSRLDLVEIVKEYVQLEKVGSNMRAPCPFHAEKTPSFFVSPTRQTWRCFGGCGEGGDMFDFVMKMEGVEFIDALRLLAKKAGVKLEKKSREERGEREKLYELYELAVQFYEKQLQASRKGKRAKNYLIERGISSESIKTWRLGYSPDSWQSLSEFLISKGYRRQEVIKSGLAIKKDDHSYDRFRGRIMFPIMNTASSPIAFGGRVFEGDDKTAKYLNSPQTPLYDKSKVLYGLDKAKMEIRRHGFCILVEGYTDVIMSSQMGHGNVISTSGTALTDQQLNILQRYTKNIYTAFDMDSAGASATKKGIEMARKKDFDVKVIDLPEGKDPADLIKEDPEKWKKAVEEVENIMEFYFKAAFRGKNPTEPKDKKEIAIELLPLIKRIPNSIERSHWIKKLAEEINVNEKAIVDQLAKTESKEKKENIKSGEVKSERKSRKEILEERILSIAAKKPEMIEKIENVTLSPFSQDIINALKTGKENQLKEKVDYFALRPIEAEDYEKEMDSCIREIKKENIKKELREAHLKIKKAEKDKNKKELKVLTEEVYELSKKLQEF